MDCCHNTSMPEQERSSTVTLAAILDGTGNAHLKDALADELLTYWASLTRLELLAHLKEIGVTKLIERQAIANAFARAQRGLAPEWKVPEYKAHAAVISHLPPSRTSSSEKAADAHSKCESVEMANDWFMFDTAGEQSSWYNVPARKLVHNTLREPPLEDQSWRARLLSDDATFVKKDGLVRFEEKAPPSSPALPVQMPWADAAPPPTSAPTLLSVFGECGDSQCGCYRLKEPRNRSRFRNLVVERTVAQLGADITPPPTTPHNLRCHDAVEQASDAAPTADTAAFASTSAAPASDEGASATGSAPAATDAPPNAADDARHEQPGIASPPPSASPPALAAVRYASVGCGNLLSDVEILSGFAERGLRIELIMLADPYYGTGLDVNDKGGLFRTLAKLFAPVRVVAFRSLHDLRHAAAKEPEVYGRCTTFAQIDANSIGALEVKALAALLLVPGGQYFQLSNNGSAGASRTCWRRKPDEPRAYSLTPNSSDVAWAKLMDVVAPAANEGFTSPLGVRESAESRARPLVLRNPPMISGFHGNDWQHRSEDRTWEQSRSQLDAALNVL